MLISSSLPSLNGVAGMSATTGALCEQQKGLGFDFTSAIGGVLKPISDFLVAREQSKTAKKAIESQEKQAKAERTLDVRDFAYAKAKSQADALIQPAQEKRNQQLIVLSAVGGAALLISALFVIGAVKAKRSA